MKALLKTITALISLSLVAPTVLADPGVDGFGIAKVKSSTSRFRAAQEAAQSGNYESARQEYAGLMQAETGNVDYIFGYAQTLFWSGDVRESIEFFAKARGLAPDYEDIWRLEYHARIAEARGRSSIGLEEFRQLAIERFPEAKWHSDVDEKSSRRYRWELAGSREYLDNGAADWTRIDASVSRRFAKSSVMILSATQASRFDSTDTQVRVTGSSDVSDVWTIAGGVEVSSEPTFLPETSYEVAVKRRFGHGWVAGTRWRSRDYSDTSVDSASVSAEYYFGRYRIAYSVEAARLESEDAFVNALALNYYGDTGHQFGIVLSAGDEIEVINPGELLRSEVQSVSITGRHPVSNLLGIGWRLATHRQGQFYRRSALGLSVFGAF